LPFENFSKAPHAKLLKHLAYNLHFSAVQPF